MSKKIEDATLKKYCVLLDEFYWEFRESLNTFTDEKSKDYLKGHAELLSAKCGSIALSSFGEMFKEKDSFKLAFFIQIIRESMIEYCQKKKSFQAADLMCSVKICLQWLKDQKTEDNTTLTTQEKVNEGKSKE